ncbi:OsmC family protein [Elioraea rosea]|uniref:OsmC family protein n=1 Tax=Elioraea rosea TaxID=2492390 RepID=UPI001182539A|nr:OsmC family protein [Elioraea rosea]
MPAITVSLANVEGTGAAMGWAGSHTLVVDRPQDRAGGTGLGFNGGELLALALGGCFCNDLRYAAEALGVALGRIGVSVTLELSGSPLIVTSARMSVTCETLDGSSPGRVFDHATANCTVANSLRQGIAVSIRMDEPPPPPVP